MANEQRFFKEAPAYAFEKVFEHIRRERMMGLPICRADIVVRALGFAPFAGHWLGALVTPWSVLVILAAGNRQTWPNVEVGKIMPVTLPGGAFHFLGMNEPELGRFLACSLMSPIERLYRQKEVEAFALNSLRLMMTPTQTNENTASSERLIMRRRDFFAPDTES